MHNSASHVVMLQLFLAMTQVVVIHEFDVVDRESLE
jgi:hypothetical protein